MYNTYVINGIQRNYFDPLNLTGKKKIEIIWQLFKYLYVLKEDGATCLY